MRTPPLLPLAMCAVALAGCLSVQDNPSKVVDLRVLAIQTDPPELLASGCDPNAPDSFLTWAQPITYRALIDDPQGAGRVLDYTLLTCPEQGDRQCDSDRRVELARGTTTAGVLELSVTPSLAQTADGGSLLLETLRADTYLGFGGIRVPLVLHLRGGGEEIFAQKLMVYSCARVPGMAANVNPVFPPLTVDGEPWGEGTLPTLSGVEPHLVELEDPGDDEETYVVPSLEDPPQPLTLVESWQISWHTDHGRFDPVQTGGTNLGGGVGRLSSRWFPPPEAEPREVVRVWAVARDGRGGQTWVERQFRYAP